MPSKIIQKVEDVVSEGLNKPVRIHYDNYKLSIRVFHKNIPNKWEWSETLVEQGKWLVPIGQSLEELIYHDFDILNSTLLKKIEIKKLKLIVL